MGPWNCGVVLGSREMESWNTVVRLKSYRSIGWDWGTVAYSVGWCQTIGSRGMRLGPDPGIVGYGVGTWRGIG